MRNRLFILGSILTTIICWGIYGPIMSKGQHAMEGHAILRPFVCVGLAYFAIGVLIPIFMLKFKGEDGHWSSKGIVWSLIAGATGALGALGLLLAFYFHGRPIYVIPIIFGGAPIVNSILTIFITKAEKKINSFFGAGLIMVILGAILVMVFRPAHGPAANAVVSWSDIIWQIASIAMTVLCWGAYGPVLHKGQAAMGNSRLRPFLCVGLAYFGIAVILPNVLLPFIGEVSSYTTSGILISLLAGGIGAIGALGVVYAFNFGGKPVYVMPLVFAGAPIVNTFWSLTAGSHWNDLSAVFLAGLILVIAGAAIVLVFAPKGKPPGKENEKPEPPKDSKETAPEKTQPEASKK